MMFNIYIHLIAKLLLIIGGINYLLLSTTNINILQLITIPYFTTVVYILIGLSALYLMFDRDYYLPFLGQTVIPLNSNPNILLNNPNIIHTLNTSVLKNEEVVRVNLSNLPANTRVIYWAAQKGDNVVNNPIKAYGTYANMGVSKTDDKGNLVISINCPAEYKIQKLGFSTKLTRHIHYRYEIPNVPGMFSRVYTQYIKC